MVNIRCVNSISEQVNPRGLKQIITEYCTKDGARGTEIITKLDSKGNKGIRNIQRDTFGAPKEVLDEVYGRYEKYVSAYPAYTKGVFQYTKDGVKSYLPNVSMESLCRY